jgi:hypothetical protein
MNGLSKAPTPCGQRCQALLIDFPCSIHEPLEGAGDVELPVCEQDLSHASAVLITDSLETRRYHRIHAAESVKKPSRVRFRLARVQAGLHFGRLFLVNRKPQRGGHGEILAAF